MRVGYCRVSTGEQLSALEAQIQRVEATGVERIIQDVESGRYERDGMNELLALIDEQKVTEIVATRVDRLGRDAAATDTMILLCSLKKVKITTLDGGVVEAETPQGFLMSRLSTSLAEMESRMLSMRIKKGYETRRKMRRPARGRVPFGYRLNEDNTAIEPDPQSWEQAKNLLRLLRDNEWRLSTSLDQVKGGVPFSSHVALKAWIKNPILRGATGYHKGKRHEFAEIIWDTHEALLSHDDFRSIEITLEQNRKMWGRNMNTTPKILTGLCWCPNCEKKMSYAGARSIPSIMCRTRDCVSRFKSTHESVILPEVNQRLAGRAATLGQLIDDEPPEVASMREQIANLEMLNDPDLADAIEAKRGKLDQLMAGGATPAQAARIASLAVPAVWADATHEELRLVYLEFVARIEVDRGQVLRVLLKI